MKDFFQVVKRYIAPYKRYVAGSVALNILSAILNIFSFGALVPMLDILFKTENKAYEYMPFQWDGFKDIVINNVYYFTNLQVDRLGAPTVLLLLGLFLAFATLLKTSAYFASSAIMIPLRTGVVRDIRVSLYKKVLSLPLGFFRVRRREILWHV